MFYVLAPFRFIYKIWFGMSFFTVLLVLYPFFWIFTRSDKTSSVVFFMQKFIWAPLMNVCLLVWVHAKGRKHLPKGPAIICTNHTSYHDIVLMYAVAFPRSIIFLGKSELAKWPLINILFKTGNIHIPVNRKNAQAAARSLERAEQRLKQGYTIIIFPEGTISKRAPYLYPFKSGAFKLAVKTGVPIVPMTWLDNWVLMSEPHKLFGTARPGLSRAVIHPALKTKDLSEKDIVSLQDKVRTCFEKDLEKYVYHRINRAWLRPPKK